MAEETKIQWADSTFNPVVGCQRVSPGCDNCYAAVSTPARTMKITWGAQQPRHRTSIANWKVPLRWNRGHRHFFEKHGRRRRVFCASLSDWLDSEWPIDWFVDLLELIHDTPHLDWLLLTKRIGNWRKRLETARAAAAYQGKGWLASFVDDWLNGRAPRNAWIGATVVNQEEANRDVPKLLAIPAVVRFLSMEPLLGLVRLDRISHETQVRADDTWTLNMNALTGFKATSPYSGTDGPRVDWVIVGAESGSAARPAELVWIRDLVQQCRAAGVPPFVKQLGQQVLDDGMSSPAEHWPSGKMREPIPRQQESDPAFVVRLDHAKGGEPAEWPDDVRVREFPEVAA